MKRIHDQDYEDSQNKLDSLIAVMLQLDHQVYRFPCHYSMEFVCYSSGINIINQIIK